MYMGLPKQSPLSPVVLNFVVGMLQTLHVSALPPNLALILSPHGGFMYVGAPFKGILWRLESVHTYIHTYINKYIHICIYIYICIIDV